jgi:hypothetical protein
MMKLRVAVVVALLLGAVGAAGAEQRSDWTFITRRGDQLFEGDRPFRFISFNIPNLMVIEDAYEFTRPNPWRWPNEFEIEDALESVRQMGGQVVRTYVVSVKREGSDMGDFVHVRAPGEFHEEGFRALDKVIEIAGRKKIRVMIPFVDQAKWWGGIGEYAAFRGKPAEAFWTDRQIRDDFKATVRYLITRKNAYTGVAYRDEPAILGWQTGNEINSTPEWTREIAAYIKELDPNHLIIDGKSLRGVPVWSLDDPNIDVITTHHYPWGEDHDYVRPIRAAHALTKGKKAYVVGEFGFVETEHLANAIDAVVADGISGALLWSLRMHRREGGFYWHMEVGTGQNIYKAYHWPGFASGDRYDERQVLRMMRAKAFEIRGLEPPPLEPPAPPKLLPIERASAISWQGSAGAAEYDVLRASEPDGPWEKIAASISDAEVQYRPLFNDEQAVPGREYFYRVVARNAAGASEPSNRVGPVAVDCRTLVDECRDLSWSDSTTGKVKIASENARTAQEDCHRLAMFPGSAVTYRVESPINRWRVFSFAREEDAQWEFAASSDGKMYQPISATRQAFTAGQTVYGYLTPVQFSADAASADLRYLRIAMPGKAGGAENDRRSEAAPVEIGRIEIEYDHTEQLAAAPPARPSGGAAPVNAAVFVDNPRFIQGTLAAIDKAAARGDRRLNVVVTILVDLTKDLRVKSYGWFRGPARGYQPCDRAMHNELQAALRQIFARMVRHNMDIYILPHVDAGGEVRTWRNWFDFDPRVPYEGYTYEELMIDSIAEALADTVGAETRVELALSGEMGTSLFRYPESYRQIVRRLRERRELKQLKLGVSFNHGGIAGRGNPTGAADIHLSDDGRSQMQALLDECDFVGMSFYRPVSTEPMPDDFVRGIEHFMDEFRLFGLSVPTSTPMHFSEVGIGGGSGGDEGTIDPIKAAEAPWTGSGDPRTNPWQRDAMRALRRRYHRALLDFLAEQPARWHVSAAFFWSMGSWDPQGMRHPEFADDEIVRAIERHNRAAGGG